MNHLLEKHFGLIFTTDSLGERNSFAIARRLVDTTGFRDRVSSAGVDEITRHRSFPVFRAGPALVSCRSAAFPLKIR